MKYEPIVRVGNPSLKAKVEAIALDEIKSQQTKDLVETLFEHMKHYQGVGIAAPQIGINRQVFVYGFDTNPRYPGEGPVPLTAAINPSIHSLSQSTELGFEGCLSVKPLRGKVPRAKSLVLEAYDQDGNFYRKTVSGFEARIIQHEVDHLNGMTFVERIKDFEFFGFEDELKMSQSTNK